MHGAFLLVAFLVGAAACGPASAARQQREAGVPTVPSQALVIIDRGEAASLAARSLAPSAGVGLGGSQRVFNATLVLEDELLALQPYLADAVPQLNSESWRVFPDGRMDTTYRLRPSLVWHDGAPLTTEDFLFAWQVYSTPAFGVATSGALGSMEDVFAPDERTVVVRWKRPYAEAAQDTVVPLPRHILEQAFQQMDAQTFVNHPYWANEYIGAGPYRLERREPGVSQDGVAFDAHVLGRPKIDRVRILFVADANAAIANLLSGAAHYVTRFLLYYQEGTTLQEQWAARGGGGTVVWRPTLPRMWLIQHRPEYASPRELTDLRFRKALAHAIDAGALVEIMTGGHGVVSGTMTSPLAAYRPTVEQAIAVYPYDPRLAQQLLAEAGMARGAGGAFASPTGGPFTLELWHIEGATNARENTLIAENLSRVGISAAPHVFSVTLSADNQARATAPGLFARSASSGEALLQDFTIRNIPTLENRWRGGNRGAWVNEAYSRVFDAYSVTLERNARVEQIVEMERLFTQDVGALPIYYTPEVSAYADGLLGPTTRLASEPSQPLAQVHTWEWTASPGRR